MNATGKRHKKPSGFTIIELVSVIAIMLILVSLLMVGITRAMQRAGFVECRHNLQVMHKAIMQYTMRYSGILPEFSKFKWAGQVGLLSGGYYDWKLGKDYPLDIQNKYNLMANGSYFLIFPRDPTEAKLFRCPTADPAPLNKQGVRTNYAGLSMYNYVAIDSFEDTEKRILLIRV